MGYANQLGAINLIDLNFIPTILDLLDIYDARARAFSLGIWEVEEYYVQSRLLFSFS